MSGLQGMTGRGRTRQALAIPAEPATFRVIRHPSITLEHCIGPFLAWLRHVRQRSDNTVVNYGKDIAAFVRFCSGLRLLRPGQVGFREVELYLASLDARSLSRKTINRHLNALRRFWQFLCREGIAQRNPAQECFAVKEPKTLPRYLTIASQERVLKALAQDETPLGLRDLAIVATGLFCGLRGGELAELRLIDVDLEAKRLRVVQGKGSKDRELPIVPRLEAILRAYVERGRPVLLKPPTGSLRKRQWRNAWTVDWREGGERHERTFSARNEADARAKMAQFVPAPPEASWFFVNGHPAGSMARKGGPLGRKGIRVAVRRRLLPVVGSSVHPHMLRHSFASRLRENGADVALIQEALGHENIATTAIYAHLSTPKRLEELARLLDGEGRA